MSKRTEILLSSLAFLFLAEQAHAECMEAQREHCAGLYDRRGRDAFQVNGRIDRAPVVTITQSAAGSSAVVEGNPLNSNRVGVLWSVSRYACLKYRVRICFRR